MSSRRSTRSNTSLGWAIPSEVARSAAAKLDEAEGRGRRRKAKRKDTEESASAVDPPLAKTSKSEVAVATGGTTDAATIANVAAEESKSGASGASDPSASAAASTSISLVPSILSTPCLSRCQSGGVFVTSAIPASLIGGDESQTAKVVEIKP